MRSIHCHRQRGVAIITALVVVTAATVAVAGMLWRQSVAVRKLENQNALTQARWLGRSAIEWSRLILLQDARTSAVDHAGELWAVPLAETKVADTLKNRTGGLAENEADDATVSGRIVDAQAYFNLTNLVYATSQPDHDNINKPALHAFKRLLDLLGQPEEAAGVMARRMGQLPRPVDFDALTAELVQAHLLEPGVVEALRPYVVVLPKPAPVNFNTASAEVMAASIPSLSLTQARLLAQSRDRVYFNQVSDIFSRLSSVNAKIEATADSAPAELAVGSHFFEVQGQVHNGRAEYMLAALIERDNGGLTQVIRLKE